MTTLSGGHQLQLLEGGADFFPALIAAIDQAKHEVRLETYIFDFEGTGTGVALALERAALRGLRGLCGVRDLRGWGDGASSG